MCVTVLLDFIQRQIVFFFLLKDAMFCLPLEVTSVRTKAYSNGPLGLGRLDFSARPGRGQFKMEVEITSKTSWF
jgi:hypothetical protein